MAVEEALAAAGRGDLTGDEFLNLASSLLCDVYQHHQLLKIASVECGQDAGAVSVIGALVSRYLAHVKAAGVSVHDDVVASKLAFDDTDRDVILNKAASGVIEANILDKWASLDAVERWHVISGIPEQLCRYYSTVSFPNFVSAVYCNTQDRYLAKVAASSFCPRPALYDVAVKCAAVVVEDDPAYQLLSSSLEDLDQRKDTSRDRSLSNVGNIDSKANALFLIKLMDLIGDKLEKIQDEIGRGRLLHILTQITEEDPDAETLKFLESKLGRHYRTIPPAMWDRFTLLLDITPFHGDILAKYFGDDGMLSLALLLKSLVDGEIDPASIFHVLESESEDEGARDGEGQ